MADRVEVKLSNGEWVIRTDSNISKEELECQMRCCWKSKKGIFCHAPMIPVRNERLNPPISFRQKNDEMIHILGCEYDKRRNKETSTTLDSRAIGRKPKDIWDAMEKKGKEGKGNKKKATTASGASGNGEDETGGDSPRSRTVQMVSKIPSSPESLAALLLDLSVDAEYAETKVSDLIIDHRTVNKFRKNGIPDGDYVLVLAKRLAPQNRIFPTDRYEIVLTDALYDASTEPKPYGCMHFRLNLRGKARENMFKYLKLKGDNTYILIFSSWKKDPNNENTYSAVAVNDAHIGRIRLPDSSDD